jgi:formylglycine-generating enzyme required for sulfatase activity
MSTADNIISLFEIYSGLTYYNVEKKEDNSEYCLLRVNKFFIRKNAEEFIYIPKVSDIDRSLIKEIIEKFDPVIINIFNWELEIGYKKDANSFFSFLFNLTNTEFFLEDILESTKIKQNYYHRYFSIFSAPETPLFYNNNNALETLLEWSRLSVKVPLMILGNRGIGKTWLLKRYCNLQFQEHKKNAFQSPFPLYINLGNLSKDIQNIDVLSDMISKNFINQYKISLNDSGTILEALITNGNIILVLDGLDEMSYQYNKEILQRNIWQIFLLLRKSNGVILSSRTGLFSSYEEIYRYFAFYKFKTIKLEHKEHIQDLYKVKNDFCIFDIKPLKNTSISIEYLEDDEYKKYYEKGQDKYLKIHKKYNNLENTIQFEILSLVENIPGCKDALYVKLGSDKMNLHDIYLEIITDEIIKYNIQHHRAMGHIPILAENRSIPYGVNEKIELLSNLAWYLFDRKTKLFSRSELKAFIINKERWDYETVVEDLKIQTVITIENEKLKFISDGIHAFFVSLYINKLFVKTDGLKKISEGFRILGSYNFIGDNFGLKVLSFLYSFFQSDKKHFNKIFTEYLTNNKFYNESKLQYYRYLKENIDGSLDVSIPVNNKKLFWQESDFLNNEAIKQNIDMVLIPVGKANKAPFYISATEITNKQYKSFLFDNMVLKTVKDKYKINRKGISQIEFIDKKSKFKTSYYTSFLPKYWIRSCDKKGNPYADLINEYYLIDWINSETPYKGKEHHPVVWISWFAAAQYCNWLSINSNLEPYYLFELSENGKFKHVRINFNNEGFRMPSENEWEMVASENGLNKKYIWDKYYDENNNLTVDGLLLKERLERERDESYPVKSEDSNSLGIYGLMGNVREWVDEPKNLIITENDPQIFKGAAWLTDKIGLDFNISFKILTQNTNPDIGFRIVRNLSNRELLLI